MAERKKKKKKKQQQKANGGVGIIVVQNNQSSQTSIPVKRSLRAIRKKTLRCKQITSNQNRKAADVLTKNGLES